MKRTLYLLSILALCFTMAVPVFAQGRRGGRRGSPFANFEQKDPKVGAEAPGFKLEDTKGKKHDLADYKGKFVVLEFGALT